MLSSFGVATPTHTIFLVSWSRRFAVGTETNNAVYELENRVVTHRKRAYCGCRGHLQAGNYPSHNQVADIWREMFVAGQLQPAFKANIVEITQRMAKHGLSAPKLASKSGVDEKTIRRLLKGGRSYASTFRDLAKILATEDTCNLLMLTDPQSQPDCTDEEDIAYLTCTIKLELRGKKKPEESQISIALMSIAEAIKQKGIVFVNETKAGSILATLCFSDEHDLHAFVHDFCRGTFYEIGIVTLDVPTTIDVIPDIRFLLAKQQQGDHVRNERVLREIYSGVFMRQPFFVTVREASTNAPDLLLTITVPQRGVLRMDVQPSLGDQRGVAARLDN